MVNVNNLQFKNPTICISIINDYIVITTKKIGSRYFEDLSLDKNKQQVNTINLFLHDEYNHNINTKYKFYDYVIEVSPNTLIDEYIFLKLLGIQNFSELFSSEIFSKYKIVFITREPIHRFFTGFFEVIDSIIGVLQFDRWNLHTFEIIKKYFNLEEYKSLNTLSQDKINFILNEYTQSITTNIFNDEHLSLWNTFLLNFLEKQNLISNIEIIDLNDSNKLSIFNKLDQPSNKPWLNKWLDDESNKPYIDELLLKYKTIFDIEIQSYKYLINHGQS